MMNTFDNTSTNTTSPLTPGLGIRPEDPIKHTPTREQIKNVDPNNDYTVEGNNPTDGDIKISELGLEHPNEDQVSTYYQYHTSRMVIDIPPNLGHQLKYNHYYDEKKKIDPRVALANLSCYLLLKSSYYHSYLKYSPSTRQNDVKDIIEIDGGRYYGYKYMALLMEVRGFDTWVVINKVAAIHMFGLRLKREGDGMVWRNANQTINIPYDWQGLVNQNKYYDYQGNIVHFGYTFDNLTKLSEGIPGEWIDFKGLIELIVQQEEAGNFTIRPMKGDSISKSMSRLGPLVEKLKKTDVLRYIAFWTFADQTKRTIKDVKVASVFNAHFADVTTYDQFVTAIDAFWFPSESDASLTETEKTLAEESKIGSNSPLDYHTLEIQNFDILIEKNPNFKTKRRKVVLAKGDRAFSVLMKDYEFLKIDEEKFPLTTAAIKDTTLPLSVFFKKGEQYFMFNDNWALWEEMFNKFPDQTRDIIDEIRTRNRFDKNITSYFQFVLYTLPAYLKKHTGYDWACMPKLVTSMNELEPPKEDDNGTRRTRSAFTPIVDNEKKTVEVPFVSVAVHGGYGTTYCYAKDYNVLTAGFSYDGHAVTNEIEQKLNGRDDYGLMYYTLDGSDQAQGYPTFLIIFERLQGKTRVHFHRTHPSRSKQGDYNPIHNWIRVCYNWMVGNINKDRIKAQQGDLAFISDAIPEKVKEQLQGANSYDSHAFDKLVPMAAFTKTGVNILAYANVENDTWLRHPEHEDVLIPAGEYAVYQCRSWEANPKGIWTLRID